MNDLAFAVKDSQCFVQVLKKSKIKKAEMLKFYFGADFFGDDKGTPFMASHKYNDRLVATYRKMFGKKQSGLMCSSLEKGEYLELE